MSGGADGAPSRTVVEGAAGLAAHVGRALGTSAWHEIVQRDVDAFGAVTADEQWIHVDPERAAAGPFGTTIAHGFLTLSLCSGFLSEVLEVRGAGMLVNYGLERVRFPAPVPVGSRVRGRGELLSLAEVTGGHQAVVRMTVELQGAGKPACVAEHVVRILS